MSLYTIIEILLIVILTGWALAAIPLIFWALSQWQTWIPIGIVLLACVSWYVDGIRRDYLFAEKERQTAYATLHEPEFAWEQRQVELWKSGRGTPIEWASDWLMSKKDFEIATGHLVSDRH